MTAPIIATVSGERDGVKWSHVEHHYGPPRFVYHEFRGVKFKRYPDRCYAVVSGNRRGPCRHDKPTAFRAWLRKGFVGFVGSGR